MLPMSAVEAFGRCGLAYQECVDLRSGSHEPYKASAGTRHPAFQCTSLALLINLNMNLTIEPEFNSWHGAGNLQPDSPTA